MNRQSAAGRGMSRETRRRERVAKAIAIVGAQWGDEGKGKVVDYLAGSFDFSARYGGGHNAGHTVIINGHKFVLQLMPCGILRPGKKAIIGSGLVVDPAALIAEVESVTKDGVDVNGRLFLSNRAHLIFPFHRELEKSAEAARGPHRIGTTSRGIGPAYEDKMARCGLRVCDLMDAERFERKLEHAIEEKDAFSRSCYGQGLDTAGILESYGKMAGKIRGFVTDTSALVNCALAEGKSILFEGAQGTMLDIDHGTYPYVTSSSATAGGACTGLGIAPTRVTGVIGVTKAYTTRVGGGPFPTEMPDLDAQAVRDRGNEYGAVTGRPRRCGWLDLMMLRYAIQVNGIDSLVVTKLDVFDTQKEIQVCVGYKYRGAKLSEMPAEVEVLAEITPEYKTLPGWQQRTDHIRAAQELPKAASDYLKFISDRLGVEIGMISTGPERDATIIPPGTKLASWL